MAIVHIHGALATVRILTRAAVVALHSRGPSCAIALGTEQSGAIGFPFEHQHILFEQSSRVTQEKKRSKETKTLTDQESRRTETSQLNKQEREPAGALLTQYYLELYFGVVCTKLVHCSIIQGYGILDYTFDLTAIAVTVS